jgi:hypothetical protein
MPAIGDPASDSPALVSAIAALPHPRPHPRRPMNEHAYYL